MDDKKFKELLSQVADWQIPKLSQTEIKEARQRNRGRRSNEELYQEEHEEIFLELFDGHNPTMAPELLKVKNQSCVCEDCGCVCAEGRRKERKLYETGVQAKRNWRERCLTCGLSKNPFTGRFELTSTEASHVWTKFLRDSRGIYATPGNRARFNSDLDDSDK